jgi:hypothetical protein
MLIFCSDDSKIPQGVDPDSVIVFTYDDVIEKFSSNRGDVIQYAHEKPYELQLYVKLEFVINPGKYRDTGRCRCTGRSRPSCRACQRGTSIRSDYEINSIITDIKQRVKSRLETRIENINGFFFICKGVTSFLSWSILLINLQRGTFRKTKTESFLYLQSAVDLKSILQKYIKKYERNPLSKLARICGLKNDDSEISRHVKMPTYSGSICPDLQTISIRSELLVLSISMKMLFKIFSPCHQKNKMYLFQQFAQYIFNTSFRRHMQKIM